MDLLRVHGNERIDWKDFQFLAERSVADAAFAGLAGLFGGGTGAWFLQGFKATVAGTVITVPLGTALLAADVQGTTQYGFVADDGNASQAVDVGSFADGTYGVYVRFAWVESASGSRLFWNASGQGSEYPKTVYTRLEASWQVKVDSGNPGTSWTKVCDAAKVGAAVTLTDKRDLLFEGKVDTSYAQQWGDGGNDRNADRQQYGVKTLHDWIQAMRRTVKDHAGADHEWYEDVGWGLDHTVESSDLVAFCTVSGFVEVTGGVLVNRTVPGGIAYHGGRRLNIANKVVTYAANVVNYAFLDANDTLVVREAPSAPQAGEQRLWAATCDATTVTSVDLTTSRLEGFWFKDIFVGVNGTKGLYLDGDLGLLSTGDLLVKSANGDLTLQSTGLGKINLTTLRAVLSGVLETQSTITTTTGSNNDLKLEPDGTGAVRVEDSDFKVGTQGSPANAVITEAGAISGASLAVTGAISGASVAATGAVTGGSLDIGGGAATISGAGAIVGASLSVTGAVGGGAASFTATGAATGVKAVGGTTNGIGVEGHGDGDATAITGWEGYGVVGFGGAGGSDGGVGGVGAGGGYGVHGKGGGTSGTGVYGEGGGPNGAGMACVGIGTGSGLYGEGGGSEGIGVEGHGDGDATSLAAYAGAGVVGKGGANNKLGTVGLGTGSGSGVYGSGGSTEGIGVEGHGDADATDLSTYAGAGIVGIGGANDKYGLVGVGGGTNGSGVFGKGKGTGSAVLCDHDTPGGPRLTLAFAPVGGNGGDDIVFVNANNGAGHVGTAAGMIEVTVAGVGPRYIRLWQA